MVTVRDSADLAGDLPGRTPAALSHNTGCGGEYRGKNPHRDGFRLPVQRTAGGAGVPVGTVGVDLMVVVKFLWSGNCWPDSRATVRTTEQDSDHGRERHATLGMKGNGLTGRRGRASPKLRAPLRGRAEPLLRKAPGAGRLQPPDQDLDARWPARARRGCGAGLPGAELLDWAVIKSASAWCLRIFAHDVVLIEDERQYNPLTEAGNDLFSCLAEGAEH